MEGRWRQSGGSVKAWCKQGGKVEKMWKQDVSNKQDGSNFNQGGVIKFSRVFFTAGAFKKILKAQG